MDRVLARHTVTGKGFPDWLKETFSKGRGRVETEDGEFKCITLFTPSGTLTAHVGDVVARTKSGPIVVPKGYASKYMGNGGKDDEGR